MFFNYTWQCGLLWTVMYIAGLASLKKAHPPSPSSYQIANRTAANAEISGQPPRLTWRFSSGLSLHSLVDSVKVSINFPHATSLFSPENCFFKVIIYLLPLQSYYKVFWGLRVEGLWVCDIYFSFMAILCMMISYEFLY